ncbi:DEAD/DEAH box helicase [Cohnella thermotolerans]|uniref:DEAD/DEAH box helicase n=1 Tax=Cohnella thermotolerans TaxID=329858 RepID=UPI00042A9164|nr:DEAD/DEAH box helicase [Cohnella thermotolerans]
MIDQPISPAGGENGAAGSAARAFEAIGVDARLAAKLAEAGMTGPTPVQAGAIPALAAGRDGILRSPTGTGKTLAYLLPTLQRIDPQRRETQAVIMAPTQELAMQIVRVAETYGEPLGIQTVALIGGAALSRQLERMKRRPQLVVGTPGRVWEVAKLKKLPLHAVKTVVVDETDRVFALGGKRDVESVLRGASRERQTVFVSATRSEAMREAESRWLNNPWETDATDERSGNGLPATIEHGFIVCDRRDKIDMVRRLARHLKPSGALVFVNDIERIGELVSKLRYEGFAADALYGDTPGRERGETMRKFREGRTKLLIATDVAARGLDIPGLPLVVQFEPALDADHYVHRAGRTGRMGRAGRSITLIEPQERFIMAKLGKRLGIDIAELGMREGRLLPAQELRRVRDADLSPRARAGTARGPGGRRSPAPQESGPPAAVKRKAPAAAPAGKPVRRPAPDAAALPPGSAAGRPARVPRAAKSKADRKRDSKNKGAPRWLKEKRNASEPPTP